LGVTEFVNADVIATGLSAFQPDRVALVAGRIMLARLRELAGRGTSFAFETTLSGRRYAPWLGHLTETGYAFHLVFLWLPSPEFALERVRDRVLRGGHDVPEDTVRRRYHSGLRNFFALYRPLATTWRMYDNSGPSPPQLLAAGTGDEVTHVSDEPRWEKLHQTYGGP
jgi:predicted ABC-type ATPase